MNNTTINRNLQILVSVALMAIVLLCPFTAWAHIESGQAGGFLSGLSHPVSGLDHVLAMGSAAWRSGNVAAACCLPYDDGLWRHARLNGNSCSRH